MIQPGLGNGAAGPNQPGTATDLVQPVSGTVESATAKRRGQGDASQVPDKTPEFVVGLPAPTVATSTVDQSVTTAVSQPGLPTPAEQVAMRLVPLRRGPDGVHRMTIHLNPDDLGPISVVAEVRGGAIAVQLHSATEAGRAALQASLPDLRQNLIDGGFGSCALDLQQGDAGQSQPQAQPQPNRSQPERQPAPVSPIPVDETPLPGQSALDLRV
jgi:flagellar hook-length control protein FliK